MIEPDEQKVLDLLRDAWNEFVNLPVQHPEDRVEFMRAIHALQNIVLSRPTLRDMKEIWSPIKPGPDIGTL